MTVAVNYLGVLVAAISSMVVGGIWYGPLFGKAYSKAMGFDSMSHEKKEEMKKGMSAMYFKQFVASFVTAWVLAIFIHKAGSASSATAVKVAVGAWLGFILPVKFGDSIWGGKKELFYLGASHSLVGLIVMGYLLSLWK